jgi:hypothetical protein
MGFLMTAGSPVQGTKVFMHGQWYRPIGNNGCREGMGQDITGIIKSLQTTAVNRCRERLDAAALKARGLISRGEDESVKDPAPDDQYGVTSVLKRRHGL